MDAVERRLRERGFDVSVARRQDRYLTLGAEATLATVHQCVPDKNLFEQVIGRAIDHVLIASGGNTPRVAVFAELLALVYGGSGVALEMPISRKDGSMVALRLARANTIWRQTNTAPWEWTDEFRAAIS